MIRIKSKTGGMYFKLEKNDWDGDYKGFFVAVKKLKTWVFDPPEMDESNFWYVGPAEVKALEEIYSKHITKTRMATISDKVAGYEPLKRTGGRFARKELRY